MNRRRFMFSGLTLPALLFGTGCNDGKDPDLLVETQRLDLGAPSPLTPVTFEQSENNRVRQAQSSVILGTTVGSLVGFGYDMPIYHRYAQAAPSSVLGDFSEFVTRSNVHTERNAVDSYVQMNIEKFGLHSSDLNFAIIEDVDQDRRNVAALKMAVEDLYQEVRSIWNRYYSSEISTSERDFEISSLRPDAAEIELERNRTVSSARCYRTSANSVYDFNLNSTAHLDLQLTEAQKAMNDFYSDRTEELIRQIKFG